MAFGSPKYKNEGSFTKYWTLKDGEPIVGRIIPPIKALAEEGRWAAFHAIHFGYKVRGNGDKARPEPFACIQEMDWKTKIVKVPCAECVKNDQVKTEVEDLKAQYKNAGRSEEDIKTLLAPKTGYQQNHNRDSKWYINFMKEDGEIGVLLISNDTYKKKLLPLIEEIKEKYDGMDPLLGGVVFKFSRLGKKLDATDSVNYVTMLEEFTDSAGKTRKSETIKVVEWTEAEVEKAETKGLDLRHPDRFRRLSSDQITLLVNSSGDPEEVEEILAFGSRKERSASPPASRPAAVVTRQESTKPTSSPTTTKTVEAPVEDDEEAAAMRALEAARAKKAAAAKAAAEAAKKVEVAPVVSDDGEMTDEDFIASIKKSNQG